MNKNCHPPAQLINWVGKSVATKSHFGEKSPIRRFAFLFLDLRLSIYKVTGWEFFGRNLSTESSRAKWRAPWFFRNLSFISLVNPLKIKVCFIKAIDRTVRRFSRVITHLDVGWTLEKFVNRSPSARTPIKSAVYWFINDKRYCMRLWQLTKAKLR